MTFVERAMHKCRQLNRDTVSQPVNYLLNPKFKQICPKIGKFRPFFSLENLLKFLIRIQLIIV